MTASELERTTLLNERGWMFGHDDADSGVYTWQPDTDDGLTNGQELAYVTRLQNRDREGTL